MEKLRSISKYVILPGAVIFIITIPVTGLYNKLLVAAVITALYLVGVTMIKVLKRLHEQPAINHNLDDIQDTAWLDKVALDTDTIDLSQKNNEASTPAVVTDAYLPHSNANIVHRPPSPSMPPGAVVVDGIAGSTIRSEPSAAHAKSMHRSQQLNQRQNHEGDTASEQEMEDEGKGGTSSTIDSRTHVLDLSAVMTAKSATESMSPHVLDVSS